MLEISVGIKLNYICFVVFSGLYMMLRFAKSSIENQIKGILRNISYSILGVLIGFIIASPIFILNSKPKYKRDI